MLAGRGGPRLLPPRGGGVAIVRLSDCARALRVSTAELALAGCTGRDGRATPAPPLSCCTAPGSAFRLLAGWLWMLAPFRDGPAAERA